MTNDYLFQPGDEVPVEVLADSNGDVARDGQGVALTGEGESMSQVELVEAESDRCVGIIVDEPSVLEDPEVTEGDIAAGESAGEATLALWYPVVWMDVDSGYSPTVADYVSVGDGGDVEAYTGPTATGLGGAVDNNVGISADGSLQTDNGSDIDLDFTQDAFPFGFVFTTIAREWGAQGRVAVMKGIL